MAERFQFSDLLVISRVIGAARWKPTHLGRTVAPPQLVESGGDLTRDRAERLMAHAEAGGGLQFTGSGNSATIVRRSTRRLSIRSTPFTRMASTHRSLRP